MISKQWLKRVQDRSSTAKTTDETVLEESVGPIDNSDIFQEILQVGNGEHFVRLKPGLGRLEFEWFPEEAWQYVFGLYGLKDGQVPIIRKTFNTNPDADGIPNIEYERDPPLFVIHRLWSANSPIPLPQILKVQNPKAPIFVFSRNDLYVDLLRRIKTAASIEMSTKVRLWKVPRNFNSQKSIAASIANEASPPASRGNTPSPEGQLQPQDSWTHLLVDVETFLKLEKSTQRLIVMHEDKSNTDYKGSMTVQMAGLEVEQALVIDEKVETDFLSQYVPKVARNNVPFSTTRGGVTYVKPAGDSGRASPAPSGPMTRGRAQRSGRTIGTVGLSNLGNTCYMNSALQCVRSVEELTKFFLTKQAAEEINRDNPLGNNGQVADAYNDLLQQIYRDPPQGSVMPRQFKNTIGRIVPSFSGYGQQDSQEFLGFLLDGLQEDLSRIKKKPYIEKPDSTDEMVGNPQAIREMAAKVWDITKKRDDSVIADLFTGMYKSTLVCPVCDKVSITFDPFNNLTLQLPIENTWSREVFFFPLNDRPIRIAVDMDKQASIKALKEFVGQRTNVPAERLFIGEEFKCRFYKFFDDMKPVSEEIQPNDMIALYELESAPTNWPPPKKPAKKKAKSMPTFSHFDSNDEDEVPNWDDPMSERMLVPVLHRQPGPENSRYRKPWQHAIIPHFIIVNASEARNEDAIRRKILEKVATLTTNPEFHRDDNEDDEDDNVNDSADADLLVTTSSDADSSGDSKVVASSVDGDEELVDVKMRESQEIRDSIESDADGADSLALDSKR